MATKAERLEYSHLIQFVRPATDDESKKRNAVTEPSQSTISGEEAKHFYEELCSSETAVSTSVTAASGKRKRTKKSRHDRQDGKKSCFESGPLDRSNLPKYASFSSSFVGFSDESCQNTRESGCSRSEQNSGGTYKSVNSSTVTAVSRKQRKHSKSDEIRENSRKVSGDAKAQRVSQRVIEHRHSELLRCAQNGDEEAVTNLLELGVDVNFQDIYGWTAAMSAAFEGHVSALQCLALAGADLDLCDTRGQTALTLARKRRHTDAAQFIESCQKQDFDLTRPRLSQDERTSFYCEVCKVEFMDSDQKDHMRSTVHLFNTGKKPKNDSFLIPPTNVGYRLMLKSGWDIAKGLGPSGEGHKFPVKTCLKKDRKCLGSDIKEKAKVTHFKPHDRSAVERHGAVPLHGRVANVRTLSRRAQRAKERKDRQWEIEMRRHLS